MSEENSNEQQAPEKGDGPDPSWLNDRLERARAQERQKFSDYDDLKAKAAEYDKAQEAAKSDLQRLTERAEQAERERDEALTSALRAEVANTKGVPASSLTGSTREEMERAADALLDWRGQAAASNTLNRRGGFFSGGGGDEAPTNSKARAAAALRQLGRS